MYFPNGYKECCDIIGKLCDCDMSEELLITLAYNYKDVREHILYYYNKEEFNYD